MSSAQLEAALARLYTDAAWREQFLAAPVATARAAGLSQDDAAALAAIDRVGLQMAAASFAHKRESRRHSSPFPALLRLLGLGP
jgi:hypothetical protein